MQDERRGFLKVPIIQKIINTMWFANKNDEGIKHLVCFKPFPLPALALVLTAVSVILCTALMIGLFHQEKPLMP